MSTYKVYFSNAGIPGSGLTPEFTALNYVSNGSAISFPTISGIAGGWYKFDLTVSEDAVGVIWGSGLSDSDAYVPASFTTNDMSLDATISSRATSVEIDNIASSGLAWVTDNSAIANQVVLSGNATGWLDASGMYTVLGLNATGKIDELSNAPTNPTLAQSTALGYMQRRNKSITNSNTNKVETHNDAGTKILDADISDTGGIFTKGKLS